MMHHVNRGTGRRWPWAFIGLTLAGCTRTPTSTPTAPAGLRWLGRVAPDGAGSAGAEGATGVTGATWAWGTAGMAACFDGTGLRARVREGAGDTAAGRNFVTVAVDGGPPQVRPSPGGGAAMVLAAGLRPGRHCVEVRKRSEALVGELHVDAVTVTDGRLLPPPPAAARQLLIIGDSISAGYGARGAGPRCPFTPATEDGVGAYGMRAAALLGAEATILAWSGKGVWRNRDDTRTDTMATLWRRRRPERPPTADDGRWDGEAPQAVIVNLGTNDFAPGVPPRAAFVAAVRTLLDAVHAAFPRTHLVVALGPMLTDAYPPGQRQLSAAREMLRAAAADVPGGRGSFVEFPTHTAADGYGCDWHPSPATHAKMAARLAAHLRAQLGW